MLRPHDHANKKLWHEFPLVVILLFLLWPVSLFATDVSQMSHSIELGPDLEIFEDVHDSFTLESIERLDAKRFRHISSKVPSLQYTDHSVWVRTTLYSDQTRDIFLEVTHPIIDEIHFSYKDTLGARHFWETGLHYPDASRPFLHWNFVFPITLYAGKAQTVVWKFRNSDMMMLGMRAWDDQAFYQYDHRSMVSVGFFYGLLFGISLIVLLSYQTFRDSTYLYYLFTIISFFLFLSSNNGVGFRFLMPSVLGPYMAYLSTLSVQMMLLALLEFTRKFLDTKVQLPRYDKLLSWSGIALALSLVFGIILDPSALNAMIPYLGLTVMGIVSLATIKRRGKDRQVTYYLLGMSLPLLCGALYALQAILPVSEHFMTIDVFYWSFLFMAVFIGVGLGKRLQSLQHEKILLQKQAVDNLQKADQLKDEFLANTSHELRTPLNGIIGIAESLCGDRMNAIPVKAQRSLHLIISCGHRLLNLINDILDYSRLKSGQIKFAPKAVSLRQVVNIAFSILAPLAKKKGLELQNLVGSETPLVYTDEDRLQQILLNLVGNAIKFTESGVVSVSTQLVEQHLVVSVIDTGIGIAPESQERIFEMFQQVDASDTRNQGGTGIGLSLTKKLVMLQGGKIWVDSQLGHGSQFHFTLALAPHESNEGTGGVNPSISLGDSFGELDFSVTDGERSPDAPVILLVDDEPINLQVLVNQLGMEGYELKIATNGQAALDLIERDGPPDLLLLDLMMPGLSGFDVCVQIRQQYDASKLPIIVLTAKNQMEELIQGLDKGANDFLPKPFTRPELLARVKVHLDLHKLHNAHTRFVPQEFLQQMKLENITDVQLGDQCELYLGILVADIRDFTAMSEQRDPSETFQILNDFFQKVAPLIRSHGGFISKFLGDSIIALFPDGAFKAMNCAEEMMRVLEEANQAEDNLNPIRIGIGSHVGKAILGTVGYQSRMDVAVVSHKVGQAMLLERLSKVLGCSLIVSGDVLRLSKDAAPITRLLGRIPQPGREPYMEFYEWLGSPAKPVSPAVLATKGQFEAGVKLFWEGHPVQALLYFEQVLDANPGDKAVIAYIEKCKTKDMEWS